MRLAIVNHLPAAITVLRRVLGRESRHRIVWTATDGTEAVRQCAVERPDLILMELDLPGLDGVEATRRIMAATPCAILIVTTTVEGATSRVFDALGAGAVDAVNTPAVGGGGEAGLLAKIESLGRLIGDAGSPGSGAQPPVAPRPWLIGIGASAGGPAAVAELLRGFAPGTRAAFVVIQHLDERFAPGLADWLGGQLALPVRIAREGDAPAPGVVLLPGRADHLVLNGRGTLSYRREPADYVYRPSVDEFLLSVVAHWRAPGAGVILSGMGRDGARGLKAMREARFPTFAQDRASCAVYGMPKAAAEEGAAASILPVGEIQRALRQLLSP
jgi:two-component system response regulator WspF